MCEGGVTLDAWRDVLAVAVSRAGHGVKAGGGAVGKGETKRATWGGGKRGARRGAVRCGAGCGRNAGAGTG